MARSSAPIGVNTSVFAVAYSVLLRPLPYTDSAGVVILSLVAPDGSEYGVGLPELSEWQERLRSVDTLAGYVVRDISVRGAMEPQVIRTAVVTTAFFDVLAITGDQGGATRALRRGDQVIVSQRILSRLVDRASDTPVGVPLRFGERSYSLGAVVPADVAFPTDDVEAWIPQSWQAGQGPPPPVRVIARLKPWASAGDLEQEAAHVFRELRGLGPAAADGSINTPSLVRVTTLHDVHVGSVEPALQAMTIGSLFVLLMACSNVAILFLGRTVVRRREAAMRLALGATPGRLVRLALTESAVIAAIATVFGIALGVTGALVRMSADVLPRAGEIAIDGPVLAASGVMTVAVVLICGLVPGVDALRTRLVSAFRGMTPTVTPAAGRTRALLVVVQIALSMVLLVGAGLLARTVTRLLDEDAGVDPQRALAATLVLGDTPMLDAEERHHWLVEELVAGVRTLPGVEHVGIGGTLAPRFAPLRIGVRFIGDRDEFRFISLGSVTPGYFAAVGTPIINGRAFVEGDAMRAAVLLSALVHGSGFRVTLTWSPRFRSLDEQFQAEPGQVRQADSQDRELACL